jgi:hypothetical protein
MRVPFAGLLLGRSWPIKFEGQFKVRDERDVNTWAPAASEESQKSLWHREKPESVKFGLPCGFVER